MIAYANPCFAIQKDTSLYKRDDFGNWDTINNRNFDHYRRWDVHNNNLKEEWDLDNNNFKEEWDIHNNIDLLGQEIREIYEQMEPQPPNPELEETVKEITPNKRYKKGTIGKERDLLYSILNSLVNAQENNL